MRKMRYGMKVAPTLEVLKGDRRWTTPSCILSYGGDHMGTYYLFRHGETETNRKGSLQGYMDVPLSPTGRKQAELLAGAVADIEFDAVFTSDLSRAVETAKVVVARQPGRGLHPPCPLIIEPGLKEIHCGSLQGRTFPQIRDLWPDIYEALKQDPMDAPRPGGETYREFYSRSISAFESICRTHPDSTLAIVTHGGVIRNILAYAQGIAVNPGDPAFANCSISAVQLRSGGNTSSTFTVLKENVVDHLLVLGGDPREKSSIYHW